MGKNDIINRLFFKLLPIQVMIVAMSSINTIIDGAFAGQFIDAKTVGVIGLYFSMVNILSAQSSVFLGGTSVLCGRYMGAGDFDKTNGIFSLNLTVSALVGIFLTLISFFFSGPLASFLGASAELKPALIQYIFGYAIGIIPMCISQQVASFLQLEREYVRSYVGIAGLIISNVLLDWILVGVMRLGIFGLAIATSLSSWVYFIILCQYYFTKKAQLHFNIKNIDWSELLPMIKIGFPGAMLIFCLALRSLVINRILLRYAGNDGLSAMAAFNMLSGLIVSYCLGVGSVIRTLVSVFVGEEDKTSIKQLLKIVFTKGLAVTIVIAILIIATAGIVTRIFFPDTQSVVYGMAEQLIVIYGACIPLIMICQVFTNYLQASGHHAYVNILSIFDGFFAMVIPSLILAPYLGALGVWLSNPIGIIMTMMLTPLYCIFFWKKIPKTTDEWLFFVDSFGVKDEDKLDFRINTIDDVVNTSKRVQEFCEKHNMDKKTSYYAALCLEEMASNVVEHGFHKDNKKHTIDVHVIYKDEGVTLRIKDDCIPFNPKERAEMTSSVNPLKNIGIKMVLKLAKDVSYHNLLGLNVLSMTI